jgi:hypothetical protein
MGDIIWSKNVFILKPRCAHLESNNHKEDNIIMVSPKERGYTTDQTPRQHSDPKQNSNLWGPVLLLTALDLLSVLGPDQDPSCVCTWTFKHTDSSFL